MKIAIASDSAGYEEKERMKPLLDELGIQYADLGTVSEESVDYPDYARKVAEEVAQGHVEQGLLFCGSARAWQSPLTKCPAFAAAVAWSEGLATEAREHNDAECVYPGCAFQRLLTNLRRSCAPGSPQSLTAGATSVGLKKFARSSWTNSTIIRRQVIERSDRE